MSKRAAYTELDEVIYSSTLQSIRNVDMIGSVLVNVLNKWVYTIGFRTTLLSIWFDALLRQTFASSHHSFSESSTDASLEDLEKYI